MSKRILTGIVTSNSMNKTVVVSVERMKKHPIFEKYIKTSKKFHAHDEKSECMVGDTVEIEESRPISKTKKWKVVKIMKREALAGFTGETPDSDEHVEGGSNL